VGEAVKAAPTPLPLPAFRKGPCPKCGDARRSLRWCFKQADALSFHRMSCPEQPVEHMHNVCFGCQYDEVMLPLDAETP